MSDPHEPTSVFRLERRDGMGIVWFDDPERSVNVLRPEFERDLDRVLGELTADDRIEAGVLASAKDDFAVGADVELLASQLGDVAAVTELSRTAQRGMDRLERSPKPIVAAIHGACLGGGLELALACRARIACTDPETELGQPEVRLGLIPGAGGTQRLPRSTRLETALDMILTGRSLDARRARASGLVDETVHHALLLDVAIETARSLARGEARDEGSALDRARRLVLQGNPLGRGIVLGLAERSTRRRTRGNLPAPERAIGVIRTGLEEGMEAGLAAEASAFGDLSATPEARSLVGLFLARRDASRRAQQLSAEAPTVREVMVIGAGLMGSGIAGVTAAHLGVPVLLQDVGEGPLGSGLRAIRDYLEHRSGANGTHERDRLMSLVHPTLDERRSLRRVDLAIEAVVEDLEVKRRVLASFEERSHDRAIFASNTSSIPIDRIAAGARRPHRVVGMHYFSPVPRIPLLEVVRGSATDEETVAVAVDVGRRQGKTVIVVSDGPGFYTSRILAPYLNEAAWLVEEGASVEQVDAALVSAGFPVGPFRLLDEVGIDVGAEIAEILEEAFGERMRPAPLLERLAADGRRGRKNGRGIFRYRAGEDGFERVGDQVDEGVYAMIHVEEARVPDDDEIRERCLLQMMNEAVWTLDDEVLGSPVDGDLGAVFGLGFPAQLGGPFRELDRRGAASSVRDLRRLAEEHGVRFSVADGLVDRAETGRTFLPG